MAEKEYVTVYIFRWDLKFWRIITIFGIKVLLSLRNYHYFEEQSNYEICDVVYDLMIFMNELWLCLSDNIFH